MNFLKRGRKALHAYLYDSSINIRDRSFMVFSIAMILALYIAVIGGLIMREPVTATISTLVGAILFTAYVTFAYRTNTIKQASLVISLIVTFVFFPTMFFTNGGVYGGAPVWLVLGGFYLVMILEGKTRIILSILNGLILLGCWFIGYLYPEYVTSYSRWGNYFDSFIAVIIVGGILTIVIRFQTKLYQQECDLSEEKTKEVEEMNRAQNRFFSSMSHEIRTPINTVLGLNEVILRQEDASDEIKKDARNIQGAGKMLLAIINDILDISKIEAGKMEIVPVDYNVGTLLSDIVSMIWLKAEEKGLKFRVDVDPEVPTILFGDEVRIKQILINLLNNAVKYTNEGTVGLHVECEFLDAGNVQLNISVTDTGIGIKPDALPRLFDTFRRVDEEKNRHIEGTGLGLSIVKQLVQLMDGEVKVNSVYGQGSTFEVSLRQGVSSDRRVGELNITGAGSTGDTEKFEHSFHAPSARILIVDDNEMNLQVEKKLLEGTGMTIDLALSGQEALALTLRNHYDVIFMDHLMPEMDGIECHEKIRNQRGGLNQSSPMLVLTANAGGENLELYNNAGFDGYLLKPVSGRQLEESLLTHLPAAKIKGREGAEITGASMNTASRYSRKKAVVVATNTTSDLPRYLVQKLGISIIPCTVYTNEGAFFDNVDLDADELVRYMQDSSKPVRTEPPTEEEYLRFFSAELKKAHHLIFIAFTGGGSDEYRRACNAAKSFENVTVINSEAMSAAVGMLSMVAARLVEQNLPVEKIVAELEDVKRRLSCSFVVKSSDTITRQGRMSPTMNNIMNTFWLRPVLRMKDDKLGVGKILFGNIRKCYEKYIKYAIPAGVEPDTSLLFVPYVGMEEEDLLFIEEKINERVKFDHIIFHRSSAGVAANCGAGTFGLQYMRKGDKSYNLGAFFDEYMEESYYTEIVPDQSHEEDGNKPESKPEVPEEVTAEETATAAEKVEAVGTVAETEASSEPKPEKKWYETIPGMDGQAAVKNSGSEEVLKSVLRMFYETYEAKAEEIAGFFDTGDWSDYTIKVHALKSSARLVGFLELGDHAEELELAGKRSDIEFIAAHHRALMEEYRSAYETLSKVYGADRDLPDIEQFMLDDAYDGLSDFVEMKDFELSRMVLVSLKDYKLPPADEDRFRRIQNCLSRMDWDGIRDILRERR